MAWRLKRSNCPKWFSRKTTNKIFMYILAPSILQNFLKVPELWGCAIFGPKIAHLSWTKIFWYKALLLPSSTYWPFSLCKIQKNSYSGSGVMRMCHFWVQNYPFAPNKNFFWKIIDFILIYLLAPTILGNTHFCACLVFWVVKQCVGFVKSKR